MAQREELTRFLKAARAKISPVEMGLPSGERRRAKGLRREEVASLSGMSVTWYTWFEQGRCVQLSAAMLERLSRTLKLNPQEREYLFTLAQHRPPPLALPPDDEVPGSVRHMLDHIDLPAQVITEEWTVIGWNRLVARLFRDYGRRAPGDRNLFKILMLDERYQSHPDAFREMAKKLTARFKWDYSHTSRVEVFDALIEEMHARSEAFRTYWSCSEISAYFSDTHSIHVPGLGEIAMRHSSYKIEEAPTLRLMLFAPADPASAERLRRVVEEMRDEAEGDYAPDPAPVGWWRGS